MGRACQGGLRVAKRSITRRGALNRLGAVAALACAPRVLAQAPPAEAITPALMGAARREGEVHLYTAMEIAVAERYAKVFEGKFPGIRVRVERSGAERIFSRIAQEYASRIYNVDLVNTTDAAHVLAFKREGWLAPYVPADAARHYAPGHIDPEGTFATLRILFSVIAYNTALVKAEDAPEGFLDLLQPKWSGKLVKAHPGYSGLILTATHAIARELGWGYFETLARQRVMQVQSGVDPPKIRRWRSASGLCRSTALTTSPCSTRTGVSPSRWSIPPKARRSSTVPTPSSAPLQTRMRRGSIKTGCAPPRGSRRLSI